MRVSLGVAASLAALATLGGAYTPESTNATDEIASQSLQNLRQAVQDGSLKEALAAKNVSQDCTVENAVVRKEYSLLTNDEKLNYTNAVLCLMSSPSQTPEGLAPGAKSRYDDFVAIHANLTLTIHMTGNFLSWHRLFVHSFETALRDECGYTGYQPYWNWGKSAVDPIHSPYFDGSAYSQGGNGIYKPNKTCIAPIANAPCIPPGVGGGCVETGPYAGIPSNLSSPSPVYPDIPANQTLLAYWPRCLKRDISPYITSTYSRDDTLHDLLTNATWSENGIGAFQDHLQGETEDRDYYDLHSAGHFTYVGDPAGDFYISPGDPMFFLHHGMIDRVWWMWQNQNGADLVGDRLFAINGTRTMYDDPPSEDATVEDVLDMGYVGEAGRTIKEGVSTMGGMYCYVYDG